MATFETSLKSRLIYVFAIPDEWHKDCLKVGETTLEEDDGNFPLPNSEVLNKAARDRIDQYTKTAGIAYNLLHTEMTVFFKGGTISSFNDKQVHNVLERSGVKKKTFDTVKGANEWFCCDLETVKKAIHAVKNRQNSLNASDIQDGFDLPYCMGHLAASYLSTNQCSCRAILVQRFLFLVRIQKRKGGNRFYYIISGRKIESNIS